MQGKAQGTAWFDCGSLKHGRTINQVFQGQSCTMHKKSPRKVVRLMGAVVSGKKLPE
jgi:hypothetical protein